MQSLLHLFSLTLVAVVGVCIVAVQPFPILHDFPEWMYQGWLAHHLLFGDYEAVTDLYALANYPVPNSITQFGIAVLNLIGSPIDSGRIWLAIYLAYASVLWLVLSRQLLYAQARSCNGQTRSRGTGHDGAINLLLTMTITFGPGFWNGYANFQFALLFWGTYLLAMRLRRDGVLAHLFLSLMIFFSHASVFIAFVVLVIARVFYSQLGWRYLTAIFPSIILFVWYLLATIRFDEIVQLNSFGLQEWLQYKVYTVAKQGYFHNFIIADGSSLLGNVHIVYMAGVALNLSVAVIIVAWLLYMGWHLLKAFVPLSFSSAGTKTNEEKTSKDKTSDEKTSDEENRVSIVNRRITFTALLAMLIVFLAAGKDNFGVVNLGERFLIAALVLVLVQLRCHRWIRHVWVSLAAIGAVYTMVAVIKVTGYPVEAYSVARSTTSGTLDGAIDDIYAASRHKLFNHRLYIYADHGIWLQTQDADLLPLKHITSFIVPK